MKKLSPDLLKTKQHFEVLDGMRGIAALAIVIFHFMEIAFSDFSKNFFAHGFLAVDFFFCLSGFVIGYAYDDRIASMGIWEFFKARLIRLHPLIILGSVLGLLSFLFNPFTAYQELYDTGQIALIFLSSVFLIPYPVMEERFFNLFSFNAPAWSLFWEYVANIVYALLLYRIGRRPLLLLTVISAGLIYVISSRTGNLLGGWSGENFWDGGTRVCYSFLAGLLIYRSNWIIKNNLGLAGMGILLLLAFFLPYNDWKWLTEQAVVLFYFPLLVALGAGTPVKPDLQRICEFCGKISYPLYMTHYMVMWIFLGYYNTYKPDTSQVTFIIIGGTIILIGFAYLAMVFYDIPMRRYLTEKMRKREE